MKRQRPCKVVENVVERAKSEPNESLGEPNESLGEPNESLGEPNESLGEPNESLGEPNESLGEPNESLSEPNESLSEPNESLSEPNASLSEPNESLSEPNASRGEPKTTSGDTETKNVKSPKCEYCLRMFVNGSSLKRHLTRCKLKDCEIRKKEIKVNKLDTEEKIEFVPPPPNTCRFCKTCFTHACNLTRHLKTCKEKEIYKEQLDVKYEKLIQNIETQNNTHNDNSTNITNNVTINALGKETLEHINMQKVIEMISKHKAEGQTDHKTVFVIAGNMVSDYQKMIREVPENRNLMVGHERRQTAKIKRDEKFEVEEMNEALQEAFKNTSGHFYDKMSEIEENQTRPFKRDTKEIHKKVNDLKNHGFAVGRWKDEDKVRRRFKVANMDVGSEL